MKLQPLIEKEKEISQQNDMLAAENSALRSEAKSWQSRTNQLLEQSHSIGPQQYKNMLYVMKLINYLIFSIILFFFFCLTFRMNLFNF